MELESFELVSFKDDDEFINGIRFPLTIEQSIKIISHFKSQGKWTEYYYHEIAQYYLTGDELLNVLELKAPFWNDQTIKYDFQWLAVNKNSLLIDKYKENESWPCFQSFYISNNEPSHFYMCKVEELLTIKNKNEYLRKILPIELLNTFSNNYRQFDENNFYYRLELISLKKILLSKLEYNANIKLEPTEGYWEEDN
jgi:hypothetical protein